MEARDFSSIKGGSFEAALRRRMGVGEDFLVTAEAEGGGHYQLGEYTWDSEPYKFVVTAMPMAWRTVPGKPESYILMGGTPERQKEWQKFEFDTLPELWAWLEEL